MPPPGLANLSPRKCEKLIACIFLFIESSFTVFFNENQLLEQTFTTPSTFTNGKKFLFESECTISTKFYSLPEDSYTDTFLKLGRGRVWHLIFISMINTLFGNTSGMFSFRWHSFQTILIIPFFKKRNLISFYVTLVMLITKKILIWPLKNKLVYW